jgi:hypothetical protein
MRRSLHGLLDSGEVTARFSDIFALQARRVRAALTTRLVLYGATAGALSAAAGAIGLAALGRPVFAAFALLAIGTAAAAVVAGRRRWSDSDVALFLDARLGANEAITTALGCGGDDDVANHVARVAEEALSGANARTVRPRILSRAHAVLPVALVVAVLAPRFVPAPRAPAPAPRASERVRVTLGELARVEELKTLTARTADERARREALAAKARALAERAATGVDRREALDALAKLREGVNAERAGLRTSAAGREAAARALAQNPEMQAAAEAIRRADPVALDREMERLASSLEKRSRQAALAGLDAAREAALAKGDGELAESLDEQKRLLKRRAEPSEALRELSRLLGDALPKDAGRALARLDRQSGASANALAEALASAVEGLTQAERERLAAALAAQAAGAQSESVLSKEDIERLAKALGSPEGVEALRRELEALARTPHSDASLRERAVAAVDLALAGAEGHVASAGAAAAGTPGGNQSAGEANGGKDEGGGPGTHGGETPPLAVSSFPSRAPGAPMGGIPIGQVPGVSPALPVAVRPSPRAEALEAARPRELGAVERSNVPREYREQVGRYFAP